MTDENIEPEAADVESAASAEVNEKTADTAETAAPTEAVASAEAEAEKPKPARKPRAKKADAAPQETADDVAAEAATDEVVEAEDEVVAATEASAEKPKRARAAKPKAEKAAENPAKTEAASAAKPKAAPKRGAAKHEEAPVAAQVVRAQAKYVRSSARKARLVCDNIRGKSVTDARAILAHTPRAVARDWSKLLESAVANAENNHDLDGEDLVIKAVHADEGPTIKRFRPRAMGRATKIRKRTAHLTILLTPKN
jgi:ribosomal protein L22